MVVLYSSSINKRMNVVHRCIRTPNIVLRALSTVVLYEVHSLTLNLVLLRNLPGISSYRLTPNRTKSLHFMLLELCCDLQSLRLPCT